MPDEQDVPLDPAMIKVLASDTRLDILKQLKQRRMTLTELSHALDLKKATILEHLERLTTAGLVRRVDDGERLWVYYELTRRGGYVVNPGRTRFYLLVAGSALAGVVAVALLLANTATLPPPEPQGGALFHVAETQLQAGDALHASIGPGFVGPTASFLLPPPEAAALRAGQPGILGLPLGEHAAGGVTELRPTGPVPSGTYYVLVQDAYGHSNADTMPQVTIQSVDAQVSPPVWWRGVDPDAQAELRVAGQPAQGAVLVVPAGNASADARLAVPLRAGDAALGAGALDALRSGTYDLRLLRSDNVSVPLAARLEVRDPGIAVAPLSVLAGDGQAVQVAVRAPGSASAASVRLDGSSVGSAQGEARIALPPLQAGTRDVEVGRVAHAALDVLPDLRPAIAAQGAGFVLTLNDSGRGPAAGVPVLLDGASLGSTDAAGQVAFTAANGTHVLTIAGVPRGIAVQGQGVADAARDVQAQPGSPQDLGPGGFALPVHVTSDAAVPLRVTLALDLDGQLAASQAVQLPAHGSADAVLRVVADGGSYAVTVRALLPPQVPLAGAGSAQNASGAPAPAPPPQPGASTGAGGSSAGSVAADTSAPGTLRVDVPLIFAGQPAQAGYQPIAGLQNADLQRQLEPKQAAKTPGFGPALVGIALLAALLAARRRK